MSKERDEFLCRLGGNLAREMKARGVSASDLAEATNIVASRIEQIAQAEVEAVAFEVPLLAEGLGVRAEDLVDGWDG